MKKIKLDLEPKNLSRTIWFRIDNGKYLAIEKLARKKNVPISKLLRAFVELAVKNVK